MIKNAVGLTLLILIISSCKTSAVSDDATSDVKDIAGPVPAPILIRKDDADFYNRFGDRLKAAGFSWNNFCMNVVTYQHSTGARRLEIDLHKSECGTQPMPAPHLTLVLFPAQTPFEGWDGTKNVIWTQGLHLKGDDTKKTVGYLGWDGRNQALIGNLCSFNLSKNCDLVIDNAGAISAINLK
jgi:hypothetical protein